MPRPPNSRFVNKLHSRVIGTRLRGSHTGTPWKPDAAYLLCVVSLLYRCASYLATPTAAALEGRVGLEEVEFKGRLLIKLPVS